MPGKKLKVKYKVLPFKSIQEKTYLGYLISKPNIVKMARGFKLGTGCMTQKVKKRFGKKNLKFCDEFQKNYMFFVN